MEPQSPPPPPAPFDPAARPKTGGCPKPLLIGCLVLFVVVGLVAIGGLYYAVKNLPKLMQFSLRQSETVILANLPKDVTPEERQRLEKAFEAARQRLASAKSSEEIAQDAQAINFKLLELQRKGKAITRQDVQEFTKMLEEFAGSSPQGANPP